MSPVNITPDGTTNFSGGQNAALSPHAIAQNQFALGINVSAQTGSLKPRWGILQQGLDFSKTGNHTRETGQQVSFEEIFYSGKFQSFSPYNIGPDYFVLYMVSGFIFLINVANGEVVVLNPTDQLNVYTDRINWTSAGEKFEIFDYPNRPFILDGINIHRSDASKYETPVAVLGTHNQNRVMIANAGIGWTASDPAGDPATPDAPITFMEVLLPSTGYTAQVFEIPTTTSVVDNITSMGYLQVLDKSTEIGSLLVGTKNSITAYPTFLPRSQWQGGNTGQVFGSLLISVGVAGQRAQVNVNTDYMFLSPAGQFYALTMARNDQYKWSNNPISREVYNFLKFKDLDLAFVTATAFYENKIFITCNPHRVLVASSEGRQQIDYVSSGLVVLETDNMSGLLKEVPPAWAGAWTGIQFTDLAVVNGELYCSGKHQGRNGLFKLDPNKSYDVLNGKKRLIRSVVTTREYENGDGTVNKELHSIDLGMRKMRGKVEAVVEVKPSTTETYYHLNTFKYNAPVLQCKAPFLFPNGLAPQGIRDLNLGGLSQDICMNGSKEYAYIYKGMQVRITFTGEDWELEYIKLKGIMKLQDEQITQCEEYPPDPSPNQCYNPWVIPEDNNCNEVKRG